MPRIFVKKVQIVARLPFDMADEIQKIGADIGWTASKVVTALTVNRGTELIRKYQESGQAGALEFLTQDPPPPYPMKNGEPQEECPND